MALINQIAQRGAQRVFTQIFAPIDVEQVDYSELDVSELDTFVWDRLVLGQNNEGGNDQYDDPERDNATIQLQPLIIDTALIDVQQMNNIVKTTVQGRSGTVKEYINRGDFAITVKGFITNGNKNNINVYPEEQVQNFIRIMQKPGSIVATNKRMNDFFKVTDIVINSYNLPTVEGLTNIQPFSFNAISELPNVLQLKLEE